MPKEESQHLQRIEELLTILTKIALSPLTQTELRDKKLRKIYEMTGSSTVSEIKKATGFSAGKISATWQKWEQLGMLIKTGKNYRKVV